MHVGHNSEAALRVCAPANVVASLLSCMVRHIHP